MWTGSQNKLLALFAGITVISSGALWLILSSAPEPHAPQRREAMITPGTVSALFLLILAFYPEHLIGRLSTHLVTVLIGDLLLFVPVSVLLRFLLPDLQASGVGRTPTRVGSMLVWTGGILAALLIGVWLFLSEMTEGGGPMPPPRLRLIVASVYIGLTLAGMLIAVAFLRRPLGWTRGRLCLPTADSCPSGFSGLSDERYLSNWLPAILLSSIYQPEDWARSTESRPVILRLSIAAMPRED
jgi:hypothetical protein